VTLKGFCIRIRPTGRFFYIIKRVGTRVAFIKIGDCELMTVSAAREKAKKHLHASPWGKHRHKCSEAPKRRCSTSWTALMPLPRTRQKNPTGTTVSSMKSAFADLLDVALEKITPVMVDRWQGELHQGRKKASDGLTASMNDLRALFRLCRRARHSGQKPANHRQAPQTG
jgi:hypothetical protein